MFKKGDKIKWRNGGRFSNMELIATVDYIDDAGWLWVLETGKCCTQASVEKVTTPRPHSEIIKAWADDVDAVVQANVGTNEWRDLNSDAPIGWYPYMNYRIKPEKSEVDERIEALEAELMALKEARKAESR